MGIQDLHDEYPAAYLSYGTRLFQSRERFQKSAGNIKNLQGIAFLNKLIIQSAICNMKLYSGRGILDMQNARRYLVGIELISLQT